MTTISPPTFDAPAAASAAPPARATALAGRRAIPWSRLAFAGVVGLAAVTYLVNLTVSGLGNLYYAAAAQAAAQDWTAWFFGSLDPANFITIDKPPLSTMVMGLSVRLFGLSSWSILLPQALAGIVAVAILYLSVRRTFGTPAAVIAGVVMALTPAAVLIFRFDNPDALMTLLLVGAAALLLRGLEDGRWRWVVASSVLVGLAFSTKFLQAWMVLPAFALTYAIAAPGSWRRRLVGLAIAAATVVVSSIWWVVAVELTPASMRPYIGGSETDSALELLLGYDGLGRLFGGAGGGPGGGGPGGGGGFSGEPGLFRLFNAEMGGQVAWFLPYALIATVGGVIARARTSRTDPARAAFLLWGGWLVTNALVFSFMSGIIHSYYTVVLAPAIGALVGAGTVTLWRRREAIWARVLLAGAVIATGATSWLLLDRTPEFWPGLGVGVVALSVAAALVLILPAVGERGRVTLLVGVAALAVLLGGPTAYALDTMGTAYGGGDAAAGPATAGSLFGGGPRGGVGSGVGAGAGDGGGLTTSALAEYLVANRGDATWIVAVSGADQAGSLQLATGLPVMAMGGFTGSDPAPTLAELQGYVTSGQLRYVLVGGRNGGPGGFGARTSEVSDWVQSACALVEDAGVESSLYDCAGSVTAAPAG